MGQSVNMTMSVLTGMLSVSLLPSLITGLTMSECRTGEGSLYDHTLTSLDGTRNVSLSEYSGKVVLLVNVATY